MSSFSPFSWQQCQTQVETSLLVQSQALLLKYIFLFIDNMLTICCVLLNVLITVKSFFYFLLHHKMYCSNAIKKATLT